MQKTSAQNRKPTHHLDAACAQRFGESLTGLRGLPWLRSGIALALLASPFLCSSSLSSQTLPPQQPAETKAPATAQKSTPGTAKPAASGTHKPGKPGHASATHRRPGHTPKETIAKPAPAVAATPPAPPPPDWPANHPPNPATVVWDSHGLQIQASNSSLDQILHEVATDTGAKVEGFGQDQRVFGTYGPGPAREVLSKLLDGSGYNVLMIGGAGDQPPQQILLSSSAAAAQTPANTAVTPSQPEEEQPDVPLEGQPDRPPEYPMPPRNPQQMQQEIRQQQIQQQREQQQQQQDQQQDQQQQQPQGFPRPQQQPQ